MAVIYLRVSVAGLIFNTTAPCSCDVAQYMYPTTDIKSTIKSISKSTDSMTKQEQCSRLHSFKKDIITLLFVLTQETAEIKMWKLLEDNNVSFI